MEQQKQAKIKNMTSRLEEQINEIGATLIRMSLDFSDMIQDNKEPTKEQIQHQAALTKQYRLLIRLNNSLKKENKVGIMNETEWSEKFAAIIGKKSTLGSIVVKINQNKDAV